MDETANLAEGQGGNGAPGNEAPPAESAGVTDGARDLGGNGNAEPTQAAWMSQLSRELKEDPDALKAVGGFKTISDLVAAFMAKAEQRTGGLEGALAEAAKAKGPPPSPWLDANAVKETAGKLVEEFGAAASEYYRTALSRNGLGKVLAEAGLKSHPDLARALALLGREMSEDSTVAGRPSGGGSAPVTLAEGARLY